MNQNATILAEAEEAYLRYLEALVAGEWRRCHEVSEAWLPTGTDLRVLCNNLIQRSFYNATRFPAGWIAAVEAVLARSREQAWRPAGNSANEP